MFKWTWGEVVREGEGSSGGWGEGGGVTLMGEVWTLL